MKFIIIQDLLLNNIFTVVLLMIIIIFLDKIPIYDIPEFIDVCSSQILFIEIIGMFPYITCKKWSKII